MEHQLLALKKDKNYKEIIVTVSGIKPENCNSPIVAHTVAKAYEMLEAYSQSLPWYIQNYKLNPSDESLGMVIGVALAIEKYEVVSEILAKAANAGEAYYYCAGQYELALRTGGGVEKEIEALETFLELQEEESYMLRLANLYLLVDREKEAKRLCKKMGRLFISGKTVEYADALLDSINEGKGKEFVTSSPWLDDYVFKHVSFDLTKKLVKDVTIPEEKVTKVELPVAGTEKKEEKQEEKKGKLTGFLSKYGSKSELSKKEEKKEKIVKVEKIAPIIEKCMKDVVGMKELKVSMNMVFNMIQTSKKRTGSAVLKDNIIIVGPDGCGKTTAAMTAAKAMAQIGIITNEEPIVTDYDTLVGANTEETHDNIQALFEAAVDSCIVIDNIHEFDDAGGNALGQDALEQLAKAYYAAGEEIPFIITGSESEVMALLSKVRKFEDLFGLPVIKLGQYTVEELVQIANKLADEKNLILDKGVNELISKQLKYKSKQPDFKYSRDLNTMLNAAYLKQVNRLSNMRRPSENDYYVLKTEDFAVEEQTETVEELLEELDRMIGLAGVKRQVRQMINNVKVQKMREASGITGNQGQGSLHMLFLGNAGTGKTTVARIIGKIYMQLGVLPSGHMVECDRSSLVAEHVGGTAVKVKEKVKEAMGGILFIDEAYALCSDDKDTFGKEAINTLLADMENYRDNLMVILAGYSQDMQKFMDQNQGLRSRIPTEILFEDYSTEEMVSILKKYVKDKGLYLDNGLEEDIYNLLDFRKKQKDFGNARGVRNVFEKVLANQNTRLGTMSPTEISKSDFLIIRKEDIVALGVSTEKQKTIEDYIAELNELTGLASVKAEVNSIIASVRVNQKMAELGLGSQGFGTLHMVFKGNAGTGKTTVARIIGNIYRELGVLSTGQLVECDRSDLVAGYTGQTAIKVKEKVKEAMGGILFIDEAYALCRDDSDSFGREAIDALVADIENYRKDLMVIIAGYSDDMDKFLQKNQGLKSRFPNEIIFEDYSQEELYSIFEGMVKSRKLILTESLEPQIRKLLSLRSKASDFGNARGVRNVVDEICKKRNVRISRAIQMGIDLSEEELLKIEAEDVFFEELEIEEKEENVETPFKTVDELLAELRALTGLASVKEKVNKLVSAVRINKEMELAGLPTQGFGTLHMVFKGNAGTGKTTVARLLAEIYKELGVLSSGHLIECDRSDLVAGYTGQTAVKVKEKVQEAMGGILFIDEAYALCEDAKDSFGREAINTLVADIENYRNDLMVIIAGYSDDMDKFLQQNQGLKSRFPNEIIFEDYTSQELLGIFKSNLKSRGLVMSGELDGMAEQLIAKKSAQKDFGNARGIRNLLDKICEQRNLRLMEIFNSGRRATTEELTTVEEVDLSYFL